MYNIDYEFFDLQETALSLQSFRMRRLGAYSCIRYAVPIGDVYVTCEQRSNDRKFFRCNDEKFYGEVWQCFNLSIDNAKLNNFLSYGGKLLRKMAKHSSARVMRIDPFELALQLVCSRHCSPLKAQARFDMLLKTCGKKYGKVVRGGYGKSKKLWNVPTPEELLKNQDDLQYSIFGDEAIDLVDVAELASDGWLERELFDGMSNEEARMMLRSFDVFSEVEIDRLLMNSFGRLDVFPKSKACVKLVERAFGQSIESTLEALWKRYDVPPASLYVTARTTCLERLRMLQKGWERWA